MKFPKKGSETKVSLGDEGVSIPDDPLPVLSAIRIVELFEHEGEIQCVLI
jgi:hypothetical protein